MGKTVSFLPTMPGQLSTRTLLLMTGLPLVVRHAALTMPFLTFAALSMLKSILGNVFSYQTARRIAHADHSPVSRKVRFEWWLLRHPRIDRLYILAIRPFRGLGWCARKLKLDDALSCTRQGTKNLLRSIVWMCCVAACYPGYQYDETFLMLVAWLHLLPGQVRQAHGWRLLLGLAIWQALPFIPKPASASVVAGTTSAKPLHVALVIAAGQFVNITFTYLLWRSL